MQLEFSEDQRQFKDMAHRFLEVSSPTTEVRKLMATAQGFDAGVWNRLCGELGLAGIHIPEAYGGSGFGAIELGIASEQMGHHLYCGPFFASSVMAAYALLILAPENEKAQYLTGIASGESIACLALDTLNSPSQVGATLKVSSDSRLSGTAAMVLDAHNANQMFVIAEKDETEGAAKDDGHKRLGLYTLALPDTNATIALRPTIDETRKLCRVTFNQTTATHIADLTQDDLYKLWDHISVALAHEMMGGAQRLFDSTVDYTKMRYQFGRPIGSFQGLKHRCADLLVQLEFAKAATYHAARCLDGQDNMPHAPAMAKAMASDAYIEAARTAIQLRGGIGFTWEDDTHLWFKRAKSSEVFMGSPHIHRERMIALLEQAA